MSKGQGQRQALGDLWVTRAMHRELWQHCKDRGRLRQSDLPSKGEVAFALAQLHPQKWQILMQQQGRFAGKRRGIEAVMHEVHLHLGLGKIQPGPRFSLAKEKRLAPEKVDRVWFDPAIEFRLFQGRHGRT